MIGGRHLNNCGPVIGSVPCGSQFDSSPFWGPQEGKGDVSYLIPPHFGAPENTRLM